MEEEEIVSQFEVIFQHLPGGTKENHGKPHSRLPFSGPRFELGTSKI
jgi:hypothetical protein